MSVRASGCLLIVCCCAGIVQASRPAWGADAPVDDSDPVWKAYVDAKRDADADLRGSGLDWTILRPGGLTTDEGTGRIELGESVPRVSIAREDVARLIAAVLAEPGSIGKQWEVIGGDTPITEAVRALSA